jgi:hypothetical protein
LKRSQPGDTVGGNKNGGRVRRFTAGSLETLNQIENCGGALAYLPTENSSNVKRDSPVLRIKEESLDTKEVVFSTSVQPDPARKSEQAGGMPETALKVRFAESSKVKYRYFLYFVN